MDGVMTDAQIDEALAASAGLYADLEPIIEPIDEQEILEQRLERYEFQRDVTSVTTDDNCVGDCALRAISEQFYGHDNQSEEVRRAGVAWLIKYRRLYERWVRSETYEQYVSRMSRVDEHVDRTFVFAVSDAYATRIIELVSNEDYSVAEYTPTNRRIHKTIRIVSSSQHTDPMHVVFRVEDQEDAGV